MQKNMTFDSLYKALNIIMKITDQLDHLEKSLSELEQNTKKTMSFVKSYKERIAMILYDIRFILACNLDAVFNDGRTSL